MKIKSKLPKLKFAIFGFLVLLLALSPVTSVFAQGLGHGFYGTVKIGGEDAEIGTAISARVALTEYGSCQVTTPGQYALIVQGEIEDGATINFYINEKDADQTFPFHDGWTTQLDLTVAEAEPVPEIAPTVVTNTASAVTRTSATLNGNLTGLGAASSVEVSFEWGTTNAYGNTATVTASPLSAPSVFSATVSGLNSATTYHFRAKAVGDGTTYGTDRAFTTATPPAAGGGEGGGGGGGVTLPAGTTDVRGVVDTGCRFTKSKTVNSEDGLCKLTVPKGTVSLTEELACIARISMLEMDDPPPPPEEGNVIGLAYDFQPSGATFDPPITLTFSYDPADIPEGIAEEDLVIAYYDEEAGEWVELEGCVVDPITKTITASVSHFTTFAIIGAPPPPPLAPAAFSVTNLSVKPLEVQPKEAVTITVLVANTGGTEGSYNVALKINGVKEAEKSTTIAAGRSQSVSFSASKEDAGTYSLVVDGLSASFTVVALAPVVAPAPAPPPPAPPAPAPAPPAPPAPAPPPVPEVILPPAPIWPIIAGIIGGAIIVGLLIFFEIRRRRAKQ
ncbi:MAG TPA: CARDB domain-containing protein [Dehalococcoidales bacterium]|nr:CARDB domain-containing protein [Dehalococcoidales bacterium]